MGSMAPGGGGGTPPPSRGGPPDDKRDDESGEEENEEDDTDEETVSVASSSQGSASRARPLIWSSGQGNIKEGAGGPQEDPNDPSGGENAGDGHLKPMCDLDLKTVLFEIKNPYRSTKNPYRRSVRL